MNQFFKNKSKIVEFCFFLVIAVLPFTMILSPISIGLLLGVFLIFGDKSDLKEVLLRNKVLILITVYYFFQIISMFYSSDFGISYKRIETQIPLLIIPILFALIKLDLKQIYKAKTVFIIACVIFCIIALITLGYNLIINYEHRLNYNFVQRSMYHFHYPYDVMYINVANVFLLFGGVIKKYKTPITLLFLCFIVLSGTRMGVFTYLLVTFIYGIRNFKKILNIQTILILLGVMALTVLLINTSQYVNDKFYDSLSKLGLNTKTYVSDIGEEYHNITLRQKLWNTSYEAFKEKEVLGYGTKTSKIILNDLYNKKGYKNLKDLNSHNQYLTTALELGFVGLLLLILILIISFKMVYRTKNLTQLLVVLVIMLAFFTESVLVRQKGVVFFSIFISLLIIESTLLFKNNISGVSGNKLDIKTNHQNNNN
ncbi:O-antigen ligase family protein [Aquimarina sp. 2201CG5-10]|uniref:O-antigen ligase family protein n=1 Tax=Aquimarina callyspongiae TaxID=3098150 RepID=UPI002AB49E81|nr:O-antigen ligase family protein [Aquimarina sp. 2201CG5-10]MDY8138683.1 O-antigen ligase family protein [Aquimarina sp. 2201CG5-10]